MYRYNVIAIGEDRATLGSEPSASIAAYSRGRYLSWYRPLIAHICCCPQCGKSVFFTALAHKPTLEFTNFFGVEPKNKPKQTQSTAPSRSVKLPRTPFSPGLF